MIVLLWTLQQPMERVQFGGFSFGVHECNNHFIQIFILVWSVPTWRVHFAIADLLPQWDRYLKMLSQAWKPQSLQSEMHKQHHCCSLIPILCIIVWSSGKGGKSYSRDLAQLCEISFTTMHPRSWQQRPQGTLFTVSRCKEINHQPNKLIYK